MKFEDVLPAMRAGKIAGDPDGDLARIERLELQYQPAGTDGWRPYEWNSPALLKDGWSIVEEREPFALGALTRYERKAKP